MADQLAELEQAMADLEIDDTESLIRQALDGGVEPQAVLEAMSRGMTRVGELFQKGEYFLADLVLAGEAMKEGVAVLAPMLHGSGQGKGTVVVCTVKGDIHDIGKNLVVTLLRSAGFKVIDLGVDVPEQKIVEAVRESGAGAVGLSVLLTTMVASVSDVVDALTEAGLRDRVKIGIGGACTTPELVERLGVDAMGRDAVEAVRLCEKWLCG
jgi:5-methyltetrahydrofolate--homocysteine methyltransferase